ncbi:hypothetical protein OG342_39950 [Streptomyces bobili]|uniref:hypothetical protein n=1 Tax=Streptomyces bobili TaxID=67280 RepID=UPI00225764EE|nr:hypothetical protein [Streptomyces bobili]MCX5528946.1 hypothetical protein [Streptomyces bobili]
MREDLRLLRLLPRIVRDGQALLTPPQADAGPDSEDRSGRRDVAMVHLWDPRAGYPAGRRQLCIRRRLMLSMPVIATTAVPAACAAL